MARFHINKHGVPAPCKAKPGNCPLGGNEQHFETESEAEEYVNKLNEKEYGLIRNVNQRKEYKIPEGTPRLSELDVNKIANDDYELKRSGDSWVYLNENDEVVGTMEDPVAIYSTEDASLVEVVDMGDPTVNASVKVMQALESLSKLSMIPSSIKNAAPSLKMFIPKDNLNEYSKEADYHKGILEKNGLDAFRRRIEIKGGNNTSDLFSSSSVESKMTNYFRELEKEHTKWAKENGRYINPEPIDYKPGRDSWEDIPSAQDFPIDAWRENNLDLQLINNKWAVTDTNGEIYGRLDAPAVAVNFDTETIEAIGEQKVINSYCNNARNIKELSSGNPSPMDKLGAVNFDKKNNDLSKIRNLLKHSWSFRSPSK